MNTLVVLVAFVASLVHAAPSYWAGAPAYPGYAHPGAAHPGPAHPGPAHVAVPYHGPLAAPVVLPSGYLADTPEVSALKHAHAAALAAAPADHSYAPAHGYAPAPAPATHGPAWHGPLASPVVLPSGFLADTPEVAALKAAHVATVAGSHGHGYYH